MEILTLKSAFTTSTETLATAKVRVVSWSDMVSAVPEYFALAAFAELCLRRTESRLT
jgi:hypothetical protein